MIFIQLVDKLFTQVVDFANHAAQIRHHFSDFWFESSSVTQKQRDSQTGWAILCDLLYPLSRQANYSRVIDDIATTSDRDTFQQLVLALEYLPSNSESLAIRYVTNL